MGRVRFDAADSMPGQLDAKIYSLTQLCYMKISLASSLPGIESAASSWAISLYIVRLVNYKLNYTFSSV